MELFSVRRVLAAILLGGSLSLQAATIDSLYNTGVSETGTLLADAEVDPHWVLHFTPRFDELDVPAHTLNAAWPVAEGVWMLEGPDSRWISSNPDQSVGDAAGVYTFRTTFDLTGFDITSVRISGQFLADNSVIDVRLNDVSLGIPIQGGFGAWISFEFPESAFYLEGINTLDFDVQNDPNAQEPFENPIGFRAEFDARATTPEDMPAILTQPMPVDLVTGGTLTLSVEAEGAVPLSYQWLLDGAPISGATEATYSVFGATTDLSGNYSVRVSNDLGEVTSDEVRVRVVDPLPGIYNTGVDDSRFVLFDGAEDTHYILIENPHDPSTEIPVVQNSGLFPIVDGPWLANSDRSLWIGPTNHTESAAGGDYVYRLTFDLTGYDPETAFIAGQWATDNKGVLYLNGAETAFSTEATGFGALSSFEITSGFLSGENHLDFHVRNDGLGYTGLRVENLVGSAEEGGGSLGAPRIATHPASVTRILTESATLTVVAEGVAPLSYQWFLDGAPVEGATSASYEISSVLGDAAGSYTVEVTNSEGSVTSEAAVLTVIEPEIGVFSTGVNSTGIPLAPGEADPHYIMVSSGDSSFPGPTAYILSGAPIPPWVANTETSAWIGHRPDGANGAPGAYRYRLIFEVLGEDLATASMTGQIATDDGSGGVFLNGTEILFPEGTVFGFGAYVDLNIPAGSPFVAGLNTLDFVVNNGGGSANPTGLRVENLTLSGVTTPDEPPALAVVQAAGSLTISWPVSAEGFVLEETTALPGGWTPSAETVTVEGDQNVVVVEASDTAKFFRLTQ